MPVRFTYANFPSLWDDIIASSGHEGQLVIRSIDRSLRSVIDARQVRHLILSPDQGNVVTVRGPHNGVAALRRLNPDSITEAQRALCANTGVIDVRGFFHPTFDLRPLAPLFPSLKVLRMISDAEQQITPYVPLPSETLVLFTNPSGLGGVYEHWYFRHPSESPATSEPGSDVENDYQYEVHGRRLAPRGVSRHKLPTQVKRIVVNMCGDHAPPTTMWPIVENPPSHVKDVVIVVPRYRILEGEGEMDAGCVESVLAIGILEMLRAPHPNFTLVGVDEVSEEYEDRLRELLRTDAAQVVHADVDYSVDDPLTSEMPVQIRRFAQEASEQMRVAREENPEEELETRPTEEDDEEAAEAGKVDTATTAAEEAAAVGAAVTQAAEEGEPEQQPAGEDVKAGENGTGGDVAATGPIARYGEVEVEGTGQPEDVEVGANVNRAGRGSAPSTPEGPVVPPSTSKQPLMSLQQKVDNLFARIEFLPKEQFIERVGEETAALELLEYLDPSEYDNGGST